MLTNKVAYLFFSYTREKNKLQFVCLIGGRVCNPRQQAECFEYLQPAVAAGWKPAPQLGRQIAV